MSTPQKKDADSLERKLERERALLVSLINAIPDGLFLKDTSSRFILANRAVAELVGVADAAELIGRTDQDFYPPGLAEQYLADEREVLASGRGFVDRMEPMQRGDGQRWLRVSKLPVVDGTGVLIGLVGIFRDVTAAKRAEEELQDERNLLRTLIDMLPHSIYMKDVSCRKTMANKVDVEILGRGTEAEVLGRTDYDFFSPEVAASFVEDDRSVIRTGMPVIDREEFYYLSPGRQKRWLLTSKVPLRDGRGDIVGLIGVGRDITTLKEREEKIREQAQLLDISSDAIVVRDPHNRVCYWNRSAERTFGWTAAEAMGRDADELLHPRRRDEAREALRLVMEQGAWIGDLHHATRADGEILGEARWTLVRDELGSPSRVLCVCTDVTERRGIQAQLLRAQRLESLGTLAGGIAHDLSNVLTPIVMGLESLVPFVADADAREILQTIMRSARRGASVIKQVLGFARGVEGDHRELGLSAVVEEALAIVHETFPKSIEVAFRPAEDLWTVLGSVTQLHQVVMNLCLNARDAMEGGGTLVLTLRNMHLDEAYSRTHLDARPIPYVVLQVDDNGAGMAPEIVDKIFDPFFTTKEPGKGTGLGLSTTLSIVKSHRGFINVYSEPGRGTSFRVYLPAIPRQEGASAGPSPVETPCGAGELILVIDDEEPVRQTTRQVLEQHGYRVITAADGSDGVAKFVERRAEIRCVITDMMMPHMDGAATIRTIRRLDRDAKVIATSGLPANGSLADAHNLGAQAFVMKPYSTDGLLRTLREVLQSAG